MCVPFKKSGENSNSFHRGRLFHIFNNIFAISTTVRYTMMENGNEHTVVVAGDLTAAVKSVVSTGGFHHHTNDIRNFVPEKSRIDVDDNGAVDDDVVNADVPAPKEDVTGCVHYKRRAKFVVSY